MKRKITLNIDEQVLRDIRHLAVEQDQSISVMVQLAIESYLQNWQARRNMPTPQPPRTA